MRRSKAPLCYGEVRVNPCRGSLPAMRRIPVAVGDPQLPALPTQNSSVDVILAAGEKVDQNLN